MIILGSLGLFVFTLSSIPFQSCDTTKSWRHKGNERIGLLPTNQYTGPDAKVKTLSCTLHPEFTGGLGAISLLEYMGDTGAAWPLITGYGELEGLYVITDIKYNVSNLHTNGYPRQIDFSISLKQVDDISLLGMVTDQMMQWI